MKELNIIGLGYIGLPTTLMFANNGMKVVGSDLNKDLVDTLNKGELTFKEDGLKEIFYKSLEKGVKFKCEYVNTDKYIITVPTPYCKDTKKLDPRYVIAAVKKVLEVCDKGTILVIESTISPGTIDKFVRPIIEERGFRIGEDIHLVHAPERIIPGNMVNELINNARTIGADSLEIGNKVKAWYETFCRAEIVVTDIKSAELSKVVENTFRDINIAFANELAKICDRENMDVYELIKIANKHPRVNILQPGPGVGGHCISVDPWFLVGDYPDIANIIFHAREVNDCMPKYVFNKIKKIMKENNINDFSKIGLYGMTYKENVDDLRESPTLQLLEVLEENGIDKFKIYDPYFREKKKCKQQVSDLNEFIDNSEIIVIMVNHNEIKEQQEILINKVVYDTKNIIKKAKVLYKL